MQIDTTEQSIREKIIHKSISLFKKFGVRSVSMDDIAKELGISKKTMYQFIKDKNELVSEMLERQISQEMHDLEEIDRKATNALDAYFKIWEYYQDVLNQFNPSVIYDMMKYHRDIWEGQEERVTCEGVEMIKKSLQRGIDEGLYRTDIHIDIIGTLHHQMMQMPYQEKIYPENKFDVFEIYAQFTEHFIRGIVTHKGLELLESYKNKQKPTI
jgi:TetR/AcrR family transcriptional regulator, cholesterol catabolism regulator